MGRRGRVQREAPDAAAALEIAVRFLGSRPRTEREISDRLRRAAADDAVIETTLERLRELRYVDDEAFAHWWIEQRDRHAPRGRRMLEAELRQRGVPREVIEKLRDVPLDRLPEDGGLPEDDDERAAVVLESHLRGHPVPDDRQAVQRIGMFLMRRGFDPETARRAIRRRQTDDPIPD